MTPRSSTTAAVVRRLARVVLVAFLFFGAFTSGQPWRWAVPAARADVIYELAPTVGAGATDNARVVGGTEQRYGDGFTIAGGSARMRYNGIRVSHGLGYNGAYTRYFAEEGLTSFSSQLALSSAIRLSALWMLDVSLNGALLQTSGLHPNDPAAVLQDGAVSGSMQYLTASAAQRLAYVPTPRRSYDESLAVSQLRYLEATRNGVPIDMPMTTTVMLTLRGSHLVGGRETLSIEANGADAFIEGGTARGPYAQGHVIIARVLAGWRHELSATWSTLVQAGPSTMFKMDGNGVIAPAGNAAIAYSRLPWFASLAISQTPQPNLYLGAATLNDQIMARVAVPLTRSERLYVGGYGGYAYARVADANQNMTRAYDQFIGSVSLVWRIPGTRVAAAATYTALSQRGSDVPGYAVADIARQTVFVSVRGEMAWGPGTPPLFGGPL